MINNLLGKWDELFPLQIFTQSTLLEVDCLRMKDGSECNEPAEKGTNSGMGYEIRLEVLIAFLEPIFL